MTREESSRYSVLSIVKNLLFLGERGSIVLLCVVLARLFGHPAKDVKLAIVYMSLDHREYIWAEDKLLRVNNIYVVEEWDCMRSHIKGKHLKKTCGEKALGH